MVYNKLAGTVVLALVLLAVPAAMAAPAATFPSRIISLSPTATEDLFAIGAGKQVAAVDKDSNYPKNAPRTKLDAYQPNAEAVAALEPDLVVISNDANGLVAALGKLRIPVLLVPAVANLNGVYAQIEQLGRATGHTTAAKTLVAKLRSQVSAIVKSIPRTSKQLTVYHELDNQYYSVTSKTFIGRVYTLLGLRDIADAAKNAGSGYPQLSAEYIVAANPDLIVLADSVCCHQTAAKVAQRAGWGHISAVERGGVLPVNDDIASRWGPRIVVFMRAVATRVKALDAK